jgi:hypothetical protein
VHSLCRLAEPLPSFGERWGDSALAYTMVAERDNQRVTKERTSALILLANARVWASEGWQVSITDADGKALDSAGFENWLGPIEASPLQPIHAAPLEAPPALSAEPERAAEDGDESHEAQESYGPQASYERQASSVRQAFYEAQISYDTQASEDVESEDVESEEAESEAYYEDLDAPERALEDHDFSEA